MSHRHTVIEPSAGLTVLIGPNNCGKSAIVTALQILCYNSPSKFVLRHGEKECKIIVETDDGHVVEWSRKKSGSPSYKIDGKLFDRLRGSTEVWESLNRALRLPLVQCEGSDFDVHFGEQRTPVFLLEDKGKKAAQFFASSSDASRLVEMQALHKTNTKDRRSLHRRLSEETSDVELALKTFEPLDELRLQTASLEKEFQTISQSAETAAKLETTLTQMGQLHRNATRLSAINEIVSTTPIVPNFENPQPLARACQELAVTRSQIEKCNAAASVMEAMDPPPELADPSSLEQLIDNIARQQKSADSLANVSAMLDRVAEPPTINTTKPEHLQILVNGILEVEKDLQQRRELLATAEKNIEAAKLEIKEWVSDNPTCPTCGSEMTSDSLLDGGVHQHG